MNKKRLKKLDPISEMEIYVIENMHCHSIATGKHSLYCHALLEPLAIVIKSADCCKLMDCDGQAIETGSLIDEVEGLEELLG